MAAVAGALAQRGLVPGDRVAFWLPSSADLLCAVLGAARSGIIPVLLNANLLTAERDLLLADADPALAVLDPASLADLFGGPGGEMADVPLTRPMHYTSGTTGRPKGVTSGVWDEATARAVFEDEAATWGFDADDRHMVCSPMYHTVAVRFSAGTLLSGGSLAILSRYDASLALATLREARPTTAFLVPTHLHRLLALDELGEGERFDSLRLLAHAGAACPPVLKRQAMARVAPGALWEFYGATEGQFTTCSSEEWLERPGTVGRARPGRRLRIEPLDRAEHPSDDGVGTIWCEVPSFARFEYFRKPQDTAAAWQGDAFSVGDIGHLDDDGYLHLTGRRTDLIITGGVNVYPAEIEAALAELEGVREVCVFARDDEAWGQRVCAAVVPSGAATAESLLAASRSVLAPFKVPKEIHLTSSLPVGPTGKVLRRAIHEHLGLD
jgi:acyl-CoA synthetase (AMP-forming)/AMP-acid ligase II